MEARGAGWRGKGANGGEPWVQADKKARSPPLPPAAQAPAGGDRGRGGGAFTGPHCSEMIKNQWEEERRTPRWVFVSRDTERKITECVCVCLRDPHYLPLWEIRVCEAALCMLIKVGPYQVCMCTRSQTNTLTTHTLSPQEGRLPAMIRHNRLESEWRMNEERQRWPRSATTKEEGRQRVVNVSAGQTRLSRRRGHFLKEWIHTVPLCLKNTQTV